MEVRRHNYAWMLAPAHVLLVTKIADGGLAIGLADPLRAAGHQAVVEKVAHLEAVRTALAQRRWDAVVLAEPPDDLAPRDVLGLVRQFSPSVPVIVVTDEPAEAGPLRDAGVRVLGRGELGKLGSILAQAGQNAGGGLGASFRSFASRVPIALHRTGLDGRVIYANAALAKLMGAGSPEDVVGRHMQQEFGFPRGAFLAEMSEHGEVKNQLLNWRRPDGRSVVVRETAWCLLDAHGTVAAYEGMLEVLPLDELEGVGSNDAYDYSWPLPVQPPPGPPTTQPAPEPSELLFPASPPPSPPFEPLPLAPSWPSDAAGPRMVDDDYSDFSDEEAEPPLLAAELHFEPRPLPGTPPPVGSAQTDERVTEPQAIEPALPELPPEPPPAAPEPPQPALLEEERPDSVPQPPQSPPGPPVSGNGYRHFTLAVDGDAPTSDDTADEPELPAGSSDSQVQELPPRAPVPVSEEPPPVHHGDGADGQPPELSNPDGPTSGGEPHRRRMLILEDNLDTRQLLQRVLKPHYDVDAVGDAQAAIDHLSSEHYDVLVLDIHLGGGKKTGADVLRFARTLPDHNSVPAIAVTAYALPGDRGALLNAGFNGYVSKPFTVRALLGALTDAGVPVAESV